MPADLVPVLVAWAAANAVIILLAWIAGTSWGRWLDGPGRGK